MDTQMLTRLLATYGAQPTPANLNAAQQFFATNPEIAEKRAMGVRGSGLDDNSDVFRPMLDQVMAKTDPQVDQVAQLIEQNQLPQSNAPAPAQRQASPSNKGNYGPGPSPSRQGNYGPGNDSGGGGFGEWLLALLGARATGGTTRVGGVNTNSPAPEGTYVGPMKNVTPETDPRLQGYIKGPNGEAPAAAGDPRLGNPYNRNQITNVPKLEDNISDLSRIKTNEPPPTKVEGDPGLTEEARKRQLQAEIDDENNMERLKKAEADQIRRRQQGVRATLDAARKNGRVR